jgi:hypothetical protein
MQSLGAQRAAANRVLDRRSAREQASRGVADEEQMQITHEVAISPRMGKSRYRTRLRRVWKVNRRRSPCAITGGVDSWMHLGNLETLSLMESIAEVDGKGSCFLPEYFIKIY